jgi:PAS domain S-box-containing protein
MKNSLIRVLLLEDNQNDMELVKLALQDTVQAELVYEWVRDRESFVKALEVFKPDIVLSDYNLPQFNGFEALEISIAFDKLLPFIIVTGTLAEELAVESIKCGAWDYVVKERINRLPSSFEKAMELKNERLNSKRVEAELKLVRDQESMQLKLLWDAVFHAPVSVIITNEEGIIQFVNPRFEQTTGYTIGEAVGKQPSIVKSGKQDQKFYEELWSTIMKGKEWKGELQNRNKNGELFWEEVSISPITDHNGQIHYFVAIRNDITQRKSSEKQLLDSQIRYKNLVEDINDVLFEVDLHRNVSYLSPVIAKITGFSPDEFINKPFIDLVFEEDKEIVVPRFEELFQQNELQPIEYRLRRKNGTYVWVRSFSKAIINNGIVAGIRGLLIDISKQKQVEMELIGAKERAEASDRLKTAFLNNISHEIRTPLNGILGFAPFIVDPATTYEERQDYLEMLDLSGQRLLQTVTDFMDISLITSGNFEIRPKQFQADAILNQIFQSYPVPKGKKHLGFISEISPVLKNVNLETDPAVFEKICRHLLDNAFKFTLAGSITFRAEANNGILTCYVIDTGIGIGTQVLGHIFETFVQEDVSISRGYEGSGLGLSIVKGLVGLLGGSFSVRSEKGNGSTFFFSLPYFKADSGVQISQNETVYKNRVKGNDVILIVEDDRTNYLYINILLKSLYTTLHAENGLKAIEIVKKNPDVALVLMDVKLPLLNGLDATREIKLLRPDLPVIAVTAYAQANDQVRCHEAGCDDYLPKPILKEILYNKIEKFGIKRLSNL